MNTRNTPTDFASADRAGHIVRTGRNSRSSIGRTFGRVEAMALPTAAVSALWLGAAALCTFAGPAAATDFGHHPAITGTAAAAEGIDPSTFIPGHPAGGFGGHPVHANFDHPALATYRLGQQPHIDPNTFIVQPPATTTWIVVAPQMLAAARPH